MASVFMKCHLCGTYLTESAPLWNVGGRRRVTLRCIDTKCGLIKILARSDIEIILPDEEIVAYQFLVPLNERWYRVWARKNIEGPDDTAIFSVDAGYPGAEGHEKLIINVPRFYPLNVKDNIKAKSTEILSKLRTFVVFS